MTSLNDPLVVLRAVLVMFTHDYWTAHKLALAFWQRGNVDYDDVNKVWHEFWGRGLFDED